MSKLIKSRFHDKGSSINIFGIWKLKPATAEGKKNYCSGDMKGLAVSSFSIFMSFGLLLAFPLDELISQLPKEK